MQLKRLTCKNFRCLSDLSFAPDPGINVIRGRNAQGKTSVLEAVLVAATSKSHRTNVDSELVARGQDGFSIALDVRRRDRDVTIETNWWQGAKRFKVNGVAQTKISDILGAVRVVFFSPEDIALVKGAAAVRRKFLDMSLSQLSRTYLEALQRYRQALRQRNELLRAHRVDPDLLAPWDAQLAEHGTQIREERAAFVHQIAGLAQSAYARFTAGEPLRIEYRSDVPLDDALEDVLEKQQESDIRRKTTGRGPHRDDIEIHVQETPARSHGSQGQQKSIALAIKLAEVELVKRQTGEYPILMLDEVLAELDDMRAERLFESIGGEVQCILTTTELAGRRVAVNTPHEDFFMSAGGMMKERPVEA